TTGQTHRLTQTSDAEGNPRFTRDGKRVAFTRSNNLYVMALDTASVAQMTDIRTAAATPAPSPARRSAAASGSDEQKGTDSQEFLKKEEKELLEAVRERAAKKAEDEAKRKAENPRKPFHLQATQTVASLALTPDEKYVIAGIMEPGTGAKN